MQIGYIFKKMSVFEKCHIEHYAEFTQLDLFVSGYNILQIAVQARERGLNDSILHGQNDGKNSCIWYFWCWEIQIIIMIIIIMIRAIHPEMFLSPCIFKNHDRSIVRWKWLSSTQIADNNFLQRSYGIVRHCFCRLSFSRSVTFTKYSRFCILVLWFIAYSYSSQFSHPWLCEPKSFLPVECCPLFAFWRLKPPWTIFHCNPCHTVLAFVFLLNPGPAFLMGFSQFIVDWRETFHL